MVNVLLRRNEKHVPRPSSSALIALDFMLADAYDEVIERKVFPPDELAGETYQEALRTLERYIKQHKKEPDSNVDADLTKETDFSH